MALSQESVLRFSINYARWRNIEHALARSKLRDAYEVLCYLVQLARNLLKAEWLTIQIELQ